MIEEIMIKVESRKKWTDTEIELSKDSHYKYEATGEWKDWFIKCNANGYSNFLMDLFLRPIKRNPSAKWFQLIGVVNKDTSCSINLGIKGEFIAPENGRLWVYANDFEFAYRNNYGSIDLEVKKVE
jgi:hypothetical protein